MLQFKNVSAGYEGQPILEHIDFSIPCRSITTLVGPNGCGKTTLLKTAAGQLPAIAGQILLNGTPVQTFDRKEFARHVAVLPQVRDVPAITVQGLVSHGRYPHLGFSRQLRAEDKRIVQQAMERTGVAQWADRDLRELSGGERQRAYIAMALAQDTELILLDEPTTFLDIGRQFALLELLQDLNREGKTILMVLHDLNHALRYSHNIALLADGQLRQFGTPHALLESGQLEQVFGIRIGVSGDSYTFSPKK